MERRLESATMSGRPRLHLLAFRFGLVGLSGAAVNLATLHVCYGIFGWTLPLSIGLASELSILSNFVGNDRWTFGRRDISLRRLARFNVASLGGIAIAAGITVALVHAGWPYLLADIIGIGAGAACNFAASALWTWRTSPSHTASAESPALAVLAEDTAGT